MRFMTALMLMTLMLGTALSAGSAKTVVLNVEGMTCGACATSVKIVLKKVDGVLDAHVSYQKKRAVVKYDPGRVSPAQMIEAIESKLPYEVRVVEGGNG